MTPLETQVAQLLREWMDRLSVETIQYHPDSLRGRTRDALALYDRMAQEIAREQPSKERAETR